MFQKKRQTYRPKYAQLINCWHRHCQFEREIFFSFIHIQSGHASTSSFDRFNLIPLKYINWLIIVTASRCTNLQSKWIPWAKCLLCFQKKNKEEDRNRLMEPRAVFVGMQLNAKCINYGNCVKNGVWWSIVLHFALAEGKNIFPNHERTPIWNWITHIQKI